MCISCRRRWARRGQVSTHRHGAKAEAGARTQVWLVVVPHCPPPTLLETPRVRGLGLPSRMDEEQKQSHRMSRVTWSQPLVLEMKKAKSREMMLPPKTQSKFSGAKEESRPPGSQHIGHAFCSNNMRVCPRLPWRLTELPYTGGI